MKSFSILFVEDNANDILLYKRVFDKEISNCHFRAVSTYDEYKELFRNESFIMNQPDLLLLDIKLREVSGLTILKEIKGDRIFEKIPVVIFSSSIERKDLETAYQYGANSYLEKPKTYVELKEVLKIISNYWLHLNKR